MVFPSVPLFLDPPNWHQLSRPNDETQRAAQQAMPAVAATSSMTERARVAGIPASEEPLKCPRCDSSNTKFCYFNNYNLAQPRHFCKTCRRYWTRGGSLRNVPVGGGCRRNKRKRSSAGRRPKSPTAANPNLSQQPLDPALAEFVAQPSATQPFPFMASLHSLMTSQVGLGSFGGNNNNNNNSESQLPNLLGLGASNCYPFFQSNNDQSNNVEGILETASFGRGLLGFQHDHLEPPVKMEESPGARVNLQLSKQFVTDDVRVSPYHQQQLFSSGNNNSTSHLGLWTDLSGIWSSSSSTTTPTLNTIMR